MGSRGSSSPKTTPSAPKVPKRPVNPKDSQQEQMIDEGQVQGEEYLNKLKEIGSPMIEPGVQDWARGAAVEAVRRTLTEYPELFASNKFPLRVVEDGGTPPRPRVLADANRFLGHIRVFNTANNYTGSPGWHAMPTREGLIAHEIGHMAHFCIQPGSKLSLYYNSTTEAIHAAVRELNADRRSRGEANILQGEFMRHISGYAVTDNDEAFAEAFSVHVLNPGSNSYAELVMKHWRK